MYVPSEPRGTPSRSASSGSTFIVHKKRNESLESGFEVASTYCHRKPRIAPIGRILLVSGAVLCFFVELLVCQPEPLEEGPSPSDSIPTARAKDSATSFLVSPVPASSNGNDKFTIALIVALTVAVLLLAAVYACGNSSSSSRRTKLRRKRRRNTDASTSSSTTCIVAEDIPVPDSDNDRVFLAGDNETGEAQESRRQPRAPHRGSCLRDSSIPRRHSSRFISQRPAKTRKMADAPTVRDIDRSLCEGDDELELHLSSAFPAKPVADPHTTSLQRTFKGQRLRSQARRTTGAEVPYDEPDEGSFKGVDGLGFKDEQVQRVIDKHQVVVTVEVHEPRHVCKANVGESPKSPPVVPPSTRDFPQPEFVEDLQPSHSFDARLSDSLISTTASLASAELLYVDAAAAHCNAGQVTPEEAASKEPTFAERFLSDDEKPANTEDSTEPHKASRPQAEKKGGQSYKARTQEQAECITSPAEASAIITVQGALSRKRYKKKHSGTTYKTTKWSSRIKKGGEGELGGTLEHVPDFIIGGIDEKYEARIAASPGQTNVKMAQVSQGEITKNQDPLFIVELVRKTAASPCEVANEFTRLPNTAAISSCSDPKDQAYMPPSSENVTPIVRRELEAAFPVSSKQTPWNYATETISVMKSVVRQEVANMGLPTACSF
ncbi:hypothetical protein HPB50_014039 [Hyalomma asiaticum]|uniref:Uncharacterized protein n=1 Tax=Hyalomma asiaticum TaxID=266040 RepID=A0ACB7TKE0_HYAAI|nr:hypothetical protein HPB50_014039 [Hyalomma asiaticum]